MLHGLCCSPFLNPTLVIAPVLCPLILLAGLGLRTPPARVKKPDMPAIIPRACSTPPGSRDSKDLQHDFKGTVQMLRSSAVKSDTTWP